MVEDRFYDNSVPFDDLCEEAYDKYLEDFDESEGEPMSYEDFEDYYWRY